MSATDIELAFTLERPGFLLSADLTLPGRGVTAVFGPSGCGKTTLLRLIAGLEQCPGGQLRVGDSVWQDRRSTLPSHRRGVGYVFQQAALFDHLSVRGNLDYAIRRQRPDSDAPRRDDLVERLGLGPMLDRRPPGLSGGERQRVAIARALLSGPRLLLMDEPLAALDQQAKQAILPLLEDLHDTLAVPVIYVSHDSDEVARLADHLVLMERGRVLACGAPAELLTRLDLPLASGDRAEALIDAVVTGHDEHDHLTEVRFAAGRLWLPRAPRQPGEHVRLRILARDVSLTLAPQTGSSILNHFPVTVSELAPSGAAQYLVRLDAAGTPLLALLTRRSARQLALAPGKALHAQVKTVALLA